jgi:hypothetical protein
VADKLQAGVAWLNVKLKASVSRTVTYKRGASTVGLSAALGRKLLKLTDELGGGRVSFADRDYLFAAADLNFGAGPVPPQDGDQIQDAGDPDGVTRIWEVRSPGGNEPAWNWSDPYRTRLRVHCKFVGTA